MARVSTQCSLRAAGALLFALPGCGLLDDFGFGESVGGNTASSGSTGVPSESSDGPSSPTTMATDTSPPPGSTTTESDYSTSSAGSAETTAPYPTTGSETGPDSGSTGSGSGSTGPGETTGAPVSGCGKIDVLFAIDGSASMFAERMALAAADKFVEVADALAALHGGIDYRIGITTDSDDQFIGAGCWQEPEPWIASAGHTSMETAASFKCAMGLFGQDDLMAPMGCEHVLTSAVDLLDPDMQGFLRPDALLVVVLVTDVDDYGAYDQVGGNSCGLGCATMPTPVGDLVSRLQGVKDGQAAAVTALVLAGNPALSPGLDACDRPGSCGCDGFDCDVFHADRLYEFADMLGDRGGTHDLCEGSSSLIKAIKTGLTDVVEPACAQFDG